VGTGPVVRFGGSGRRCRSRVALVLGVVKGVGKDGVHGLGRDVPSISSLDPRLSPKSFYVDAGAEPSRAISLLRSFQPSPGY
jgi:hypothetical protein